MAIGSWSKRRDVLAQPAFTNTIDGLNNRHFYSSQFWKSKIKVPANLVAGVNSFPGY